MKRLCPILLLLTVIVHFSSCEKDDICVEGDTPLLVIGFFNVEDPTASKDVLRLRIVETELNSTLGTFTDRGNLDSIGLPLRIANTSTTFAMIKDSQDDDDGNEAGRIDTLTFNYTVNERFVSKACGFVANFNELDTTRQVFSSDWIKRIEIIDTIISDSNEIHVQIFH